MRSPASQTRTVAAREDAAPRAAAATAETPRQLRLTALQCAADDSARVSRTRRFPPGGAALQREEAPELEEEEPVQGKALQREEASELEEEEPLQGKALQRQEAPGRAEMPDPLRSGVESLAGMDLSDVRVHGNSPRPAEVGALAYAQGNDIHVGPGQERHLPHEAWHVVQQRQGRVAPTTSVGGVAVNDDPSLEQEADVMGGRALNAAVPTRVA
jgi:hypothetical protein